MALEAMRPAKDISQTRTCSWARRREPHPRAGSEDRICAWSAQWCEAEQHVRGELRVDDEEGRDPVHHTVEVLWDRGQIDEGRDIVNL